MRARIALVALFVPLVATAACTGLLGDFSVAGDDNGSGGDGGNLGDATVVGDGASADGSPIGDGAPGDGGTLADGAVKCGYPGEACCTGPFAACNDGTYCATEGGAPECKLNDVRVVGVFGSFTTHGVSLFYDGNTWTKGPDPVFATSSADGNPYAPGLWSAGPNAYTAVTTAGFIMPYLSGSGARWRTCSSSDAPCPYPSTTQSLWNIIGFNSSDYWLGGENVFYHCGATCTNTVTGLTGTWATGTFAGTSSTDLWYGLYDRVFHYNGTTWTITNGVAADGIWAAAPNDVWAAGSNGSLKHFDGTTWSPSYTVAEPDGGTYKAGLSALSGTASNDVWVAGYDNPNGNVPITAHWDGTNWTYVTPPNDTNQVSSLWAGAHDEVFLSFVFGGIYKWDGVAWKTQIIPIYDAGGGVTGTPRFSVIAGAAKHR